MSQRTRGREIASQRRVNWEGVCDHVDGLVVEVEVAVLVEGGDGEEDVGVGVRPLVGVFEKEGEALSRTLRLDGVGGANSPGWLRVVTIVVCVVRAYSIFNRRFMEVVRN